MPENVSEWVIIYDRTNCNSDNNDIDLFHNVMIIFSRYYPERLGTMYIINASLTFKLFFFMSIKMANKTKRKVIFLFFLFFLFYFYFIFIIFIIFLFRKKKISF